MYKKAGLGIRSFDFGANSSFFVKNEQMSDSFFFSKNERFARKTKERIPNPVPEPADLNSP